MSDFNTFFSIATEDLPIFLGVVAVVAVFLEALKANRLKRSKKQNFDVVTEIDRLSVDRIRAEIAATKLGSPPFEIEQLANYYSLSLGQARVSFWFSLVFAAIGFLVIVGAAVLYQNGDTSSAFVKILAGVIVDAVAALFFVQSRRAQEAMSAFFEKLRNDRQFVEARKICDEICDLNIKDILKTILVLHYSGLESSAIVNVLSEKANRNSQT